MRAFDTLNAAILRCHRCRLCETRQHALCGEGNRQARLMLVAQAPGEKEDREGRMFIGPSGRMLDELLEGAGIDRGTLYMTNLVKCMLPKYRKPKADEITACAPFLERETVLVDPAVIAPLGHYAVVHVFKHYGLSLPPASELFGRSFSAGGRTIFPLQHPASALYNPGFKEVLARNYRRLGMILAELPL